MKNISNDSISFSRIIEDFEKLSKRVKNSNHKKYFQRQTFNHRILAKLQADIFMRDPYLQNITDAELLMLKRGEVFGFSFLQSSIDFFRWSRASSVEELATQAYCSAKENSILVAITALRSILEITGNAALLEKDLQEISNPKNDNIVQIDWLKKIESIIDNRIAGRRVDYPSLTKAGLRKTKNFSYKPGVLEADQTAKDLLKGVDVLDKRIKGARAAYEFFSEFAHPNLASVWTHYDRTELKLKVFDIHSYTVHHQRHHVGAVFLETFGSLLVEGIEIIGECVDELLSIDSILFNKGKEISKQSKKVIREVIRSDPKAFDSMELCPCNSSKNIQQCCGKLIKGFKFGKQSTFAKLQ